MVHKLVSKISWIIGLMSNNLYIKYLRSCGIKIGNNCVFRDRFSTRIDVTRPSLVTIGNDVDFNKNFQILTHDWSSRVFRNKYGVLVNSSGAVSLGNNIYIGTDVIVLKGVTIGDNCIIGAGSIVSHDIPSDSVAVGRPAKVICSLDEYLAKRLTLCEAEAFEYAISIIERYGRMPIYTDFSEEFPLFVDGSNIDEYPLLPIKSQLGKGFDKWLEKHEAKFMGFDAFLCEVKKKYNDKYNE